MIWLSCCQLFWTRTSKKLKSFATHATSQISLVRHEKKILENNIYDSLASWLTKELKNLRCDKKVGKLNGENSHSEKERVTKLFQEGYGILVLKVLIIWINYQDFSRYWFQQMLQQWGLISVIRTWALISVKITTSLCNDFTRLNFHRVAKDNLET